LLDTPAILQAKSRVRCFYESKNPRRQTWRPMHALRVDQSCAQQ